MEKEETPVGWLQESLEVMFQCSIGAPTLVDMTNNIVAESSGNTPVPQITDAIPEMEPAQARQSCPRKHSKRLLCDRRAIIEGMHGLQRMHAQT